MATKKEENLAALKYLAESLGVNLGDSKIAITTASEIAKVRMYDGSLEARIVPTLRGAVCVESSRAPGIKIELVDPVRDHAPEGAIYQITTYVPYGTSLGTALNGDVFSVYVGKEGIILDEPGIRRAAGLLKNK